MPRILITGATGFIGRYLIKYFIDKGFQIIAHGSSNESINKLKSHLLNNNIDFKNIDFWQQNFLDNEWDFPNFLKINNIIHCAAATKVREGTIENYDKYFSLNVLATKKLAKKALNADIDHFIHLSTGQVYGIPPSFPFTEDTPKTPINLYGFTKLMGENIILSFGILGLTYTIVRPFSVYGKGQHNILSIIKNKIMNDETLTIFGDGTQSRAFTHVNDICEAIGIILNNQRCFGEEYNLSGTKEYSINELVKFFSKKLKKRPKIVYKEANVNELKRNIADTSKIQRLEFKFRKSLEKFIENELIKLNS
ncbi:MAG: NAD-dependent epimerase/dehydratase family protein [Candidatus Thorarchaeota archaeon]